MRTLLVVCLVALNLLPGRGQSQTALPLPAPDFNQVVLAISETPSKTAFGFDLSGGLIFVEAQLSQGKDSFILDTGAPTVVINSKSNLYNPRQETAVGLSGTLSVRSVRLDRFVMDNIYKKKIHALATDISHLETLKSRRIAGLVGYEALKDHEVLIDYQQKTLTFLKQNDRRMVGNLIPVEEHKMKIRGHLPVIKVKIGRKSYLFGVDTGAEVNVINAKLYKKLKKHCLQTKEAKYLQGLDRGKCKAFSTHLRNVRLKRHSFNELEIVFADISYLNYSSGLQLDGILGYPFLKQAVFSLNYKDKKLCLWEAIPEVKLVGNEASSDDLLLSLEEAMSLVKRSIKPE